MKILLDCLLSQKIKINLLSMSQHLQQVYEKLDSDDEYLRVYKDTSETGKDNEKDLFPDSLNTRLTDYVTQTSDYMMGYSGVFGQFEFQFSIEEEKKEQESIHLVKDIQIEEAIGILEQDTYPKILGEEIERLQVVGQKVSKCDVQRELQLCLYDNYCSLHQQVNSNSGIRANDRGLLDSTFFVPIQVIVSQGQNSQAGLIQNVFLNEAQSLVQEEIVPDPRQHSKRQKSLSSQDTHHVLKNFINAFNGYIHHKASFHMVKRIFQIIQISSLQQVPNAPKQYIHSLRDLLNDLIHPKGKGESYKFDIFKQLTVKSNQDQSSYVVGNLQMQTIKQWDRISSERKIQRWTFKREEYCEVTRRLMLWYLRREYPLHIIRSGDMRDKFKAKIRQISKARNLKYVRRWIQELAHPGVCTQVYMKHNIVQGPKQEKIQFGQQSQMNSDDKETHKSKRGRKRKE